MSRPRIRVASAWFQHVYIVDTVDMATFAVDTVAMLTVAMHAVVMVSSRFESSSTNGEGKSDVKIVC